jgi:hypothetical protein
MSIGLESYIEVKNPETGKWEFKESPDDRDIFSYEALQILGHYRQEEHGCPVIEVHSGWPEDSDFLNEVLNPGELYVWWGPTTRREDWMNDNDFSHGWVTLAELLSFDYDQCFEDRYNYNRGVSNESYTLPVGVGKQTTMREFVGEFYFSRIAYLETLGKPDDVRVFYNLS